MSQHTQPKRPGVIQRARIAYQVFREGFPTRRLPASGNRQQTVYAWPAWREGQPQWQIVDYATYVNEGYNLNALIYSALAYKGRAASLPNLRAFSGDRDNPTPLPADHPLNQLLTRPNPHQSGKEFVQLQTIYQNVAGNAYTVLIRPRGGGLPTKMYPVRPDRVYIIPAAGGIQGYYYVPEGKSPKDGVPVLPEDMMHTKFPNPGDPLDGIGYGMSPLSPGARSADVDNKVTEFLKQFFDSGTMINTYITYDVPMDPDDMSAARERFKEIYGGSENWIEPAVFDQGGKVSRFGMTFDEMGFGEIDERNESRILMPFGVAPILLGTRIGLMRSTYANYNEARRAFWEDVMVPEMELLLLEYQYHLRGDDGAFVGVDYSSVPALRRNIPELVQAWRGLVEMGVPKNTASKVTDLPLGDLPDGDVVYMPFNMVPVGSPPPADAANTGADTAQMPEAEEDAEKRRLPATTTKAGYTPAQKRAHYKAIDRIAQSWEGRFAEAARQALEADRREMLALLTEAKSAAYLRKGTVDWSGYDITVTNYLKESDTWQATFAPLVQGVVTDQAARWAATLGQPSTDVQNLFARDWFNSYVMQFAQEVNETTRLNLSSMAAQAQAEGWSIPTMQKHLETLFQQYMNGDKTAEDFEWFAERMPAYRRELIARDQTLRASNAGTNELFKEWGVPQQEWLTTFDGRQRDTHAAMSGQTVAVGQPFTLPSGAQLMFPGDGSMGASLADIIQCRCVALPVVEGV